MSLIDKLSIKTFGCDIYVIEVDGKLNGYTTDMEKAREIIEKTVDKLEKDLNAKYGNIKVFRETNEDGITISYQTLGNLFNGPITIAHVITGKLVESLE